MEPIRLQETGEGEEVELDRATAFALRDQGIAIIDDLGSGHWRIKAANKVGLARVAGREIHIEPKVRLSRLIFMMSYALDKVSWREEDDLDIDSADGLVSAMAYVFEHLTRRALSQGVRQGYRTVEDTLPVMRGRLRESDQLRRHHGLPMPLEVTHDDYDPDIAENQLLLAATDRLLNTPGVPPRAQRSLRRLAERFSGVTKVAAGKPLPRWRPKQENVRYHKALRLAELILDSCSAEIGTSTDAPVSGFLFTMSTIFERFIVAALSEALAELGGIARSPHDLYLDEENQARLQPDLVWYATHGRPLAVVDAKYKVDRSSDNLYQMLAYCTALRLRRGHLVYAAGREPSVRHKIREASIEIILHRLNLELPRQDLLAQVRELALALADDSAHSPH